VIVDQLNELWQGLIDFTAQLILPDWNGLVALLPLLLLVLVVGPLVSLLALVWLVYVVRKPRTAVTFEDGPRPAPLDADGTPLLPRGEPYSAQTGLIYPPGSTHDDAGGLLTVICPMCGLGRAAEIDTCGNCGLVLRVVPRARALRRIGPPPGGTAAA
jgi:hypothetical protein